MSIYKYYMKNPSKPLLKKFGFRYDLQCSTKDCECYVYEFPVDSYKRNPVLVCSVRVYMDNGDTTVDIRNGFGLFTAWYQRNHRQFVSYKNYISQIDKKINKKLKVIGIKKVHNCFAEEK